MRKATIKSPANIAFIKYWGRRNDDLILPLNDSISMNLDNCYTITTVEFGKANEDEIKVKFYKEKYKNLNGKQLNRVLKQVNRIREKYKIKEKVKIYSENNFPADVGIASSASAFSALTCALFKALGNNISEKDLTIETRLSGSGSAARSIPNGFVEWLMGDSNRSKTSYAYSMASSDYWKLYDLTLIVDTAEKSIGSYEGHNRALNEYMKARLKNINKRIKQVREAIRETDIEKLGKAMEADAISLHTVAMNSKPPIYYLNGKTWEIIFELLKLRKKGIIGYFTMDAGPNVHLICEKKFKDILKENFEKFPGVKFIIENKVGEGAKVIREHLF